MSIKNPFTPSFGRVPHIFIDRSDIAEDVEPLMLQSIMESYLSVFDDGGLSFESSGYGYVSFALPYFRDFIMEDIIPFEEID